MNPLDPQFGDGTVARRPDAYSTYTRKFFGRWVGVYDLFGATIAPVYRRATDCLEPAPGRSILDICTGTGALARRCALRGAEVTGVDMTGAMLDKARRRTRNLEVHLEQADARWLPFPDESFDASVISLGLHDMPRRVRYRVLSEALRVTRERLVIVDYDFTRAGPLRNGLIAMVRWFETAYFPQFAAEGLGRLLAEAGRASHRAEQPRWPWSWFFSVRVLDLGTTRDSR